MKYENIHCGIFLSRPNRFIAVVKIDGKEERCHVKNTGRCRELLLPGAEVYLERSKNTNRKTAYDLIGVKKGNILINMDSQAPNKAVGEWLLKGGWWKESQDSKGPKGASEESILLKPECSYKNSRFDFYMERMEAKEKAFVEVKGVTLEEDGIARFPDAPTERGIKHIKELIEARNNGYGAYILFVIQMKGIKYMEPNDRTHKAFGEALREAVKAGVQVMAYDCIITPDTIILDAPVEVRC